MIENIVMTNFSIVFIEMMVVVMTSGYMTWVDALFRWHLFISTLLGVLVFIAGVWGLV